MSDIVIYTNEAQIAFQLQHYSSIILPSSILIDSIYCYDERGNSVPFQVFDNNLRVAANYKNVKGGYLIRQLTWKCIAKLHVSGKVMILKLDALIQNGDRNDLKGNVKLVSGKQQRKIREYSMAKRSMAMMAESSSSPESKNLEDYTLYDIGELELTNSTVTSVPLDTQIYPSSKIYLVQSYSDTVQYGYRFIATKHIPSCELYTYSDTFYVGSFNFDEAQKNDEKLILIGESTKVKCIPRIEVEEAIKKENSKIYNKESVSYNLKSESKVDIILQHHISGKNITTIKPKPYKIEDDIAEWRLEVEGEQKYEVVITYYTLEKDTK